MKKFALLFMMLFSLSAFAQNTTVFKKLENQDSLSLTEAQKDSAIFYTKFDSDYDGTYEVYQLPFRVLESAVNLFRTEYGNVSEADSTAILHRVSFYKDSTVVRNTLYLDRIYAGDKGDFVDLWNGTTDRSTFPLSATNKTSNNLLALDKVGNNNIVKQGFYIYTDESNGGLSLDANLSKHTQTANWSGLSIKTTADTSNLRFLNSKEGLIEFTFDMQSATPYTWPADINRTELQNNIPNFSFISFGAQGSGGYYGRLGHSEWEFRNNSIKLSDYNGNVILETTSNSVEINKGLNISDFAKLEILTSYPSSPQNGMIICRQDGALQRTEVYLNGAWITMASN